MAILQMQRIDIFALKKERKRLLEALQRFEVMEINDMQKEDKVFRKTDVSVPKASIEKNITLATDAVTVLNQYAPAKTNLLSMLNGRKEISVEDYDTFYEKYAETVKIAGRIMALSKEISEKKAEILKVETQIDILSPWVNLDVSMNFSETKYTRCFIGTLRNQWSLEAVYEKLAPFMPLDIDIISSSKEQTCIFVICPKEKADQVFEALRSIEFSLPSVSFDGVPAEKLVESKELLVNIKSAIQLAEKEIQSFSDDREDLLFLQDYDRLRLEKYEVIGLLPQSKHVVIISGYVSEDKAQELQRYITKNFEAEVEISKPGKKAEVPILLKNNGFSAPLEGTVAAFSPPGKGEMDPTMVMSLFYYVLFGLMLSDAGYGFVIALGCALALIKFRKTMERPMINTLKMYLFCGISTVFWGIMFGSYFGDIFDVVTTTFINESATIPVVPPLWFFPVEKPMQMLTFAMAFGIMHLLAGLAMKGYQLAKQKDYISIVYDVVFWYVLLISGVIILMSMDMITNILGIQVSISPVFVTIAGYLAILSAIGIILTNGRESKNPFKRFLKGLYALYGVSGYLSDVLSYSRLLALGLATGVIGSVINKMAAMTAGLPGGFIIFTIVVILGHTLNIGINALGAYVHTNRLQYVEFFGKFYEGGGRLFKPFGVNTKYYKFKESRENGSIK